jgi:hypothetical protein
MNHPEVFVIPVLILADYFLTVWGAILSEKKYRQHFKFENYELNPIWQKSIAQKKWFNLKLLLIVLVVAGFCFIWSIGWMQDDIFSEGLFGFFVILSSSLIGYHLTNILTFNYVARHSESISGEVVMSHLMILKMAQFRTIGLLFVFIVVTLFSPTAFVIGGLCSQIFLMFTEARWFAKARATEKKNNPPVISQ